jgi:DNA repair exonuclease SbcCD ATPase subunit
VARKTKLLQEAQANERQIVEIERKLGEGNLKIPDERRYLCEISKLRRSQQPFSALQAEVQKMQAELEECSALFTSTTAQLDAVRKERDGLQESVKALDSKKQDKQAAVQALWDEKKKLKERIDALYAEKKAVHENFKAASAQHRISMERERQRREVAARKAKVEDEIEGLEEKISKLELGVDHELESCDGLIIALEQLVQASAEKQQQQPIEQQSALQEPKKAGQGKVRRVVAPAADLVPLASKNAKEDFMAECCNKEPAHAAKEGKKKASAGAFKLPIHIVAGLSALGVGIPLGAAELPALLERLREKRQKIAGNSQARKAEVEAKKEAIGVQIAVLRQQIVEIEKEAASEGAVAKQEKKE